MKRAGAVTYCVNTVNGRNCGNRIELVSYRWAELAGMMCPDCRRANVEALAATEIGEKLEKRLEEAAK